MNVGIDKIRMRGKIKRRRLGLSARETVIGSSGRGIGGKMDWQICSRYSWLRPGRTYQCEKMEGQIICFIKTVFHLTNIRYATTLGRNKGRVSDRLSEVLPGSICQVPGLHELGTRAIKL